MTRTLCSDTCKICKFNMILIWTRSSESCSPLILETREPRRQDVNMSSSPSPSPSSSSLSSSNYSKRNCYSIRCDGSLTDHPPFGIAHVLSHLRCTLLCCGTARIQVVLLCDTIPFTPPHCIFMFTCRFY